MQSKAKLSPDQAAFICRIAREKGGLAISPSKVAFIEQRLMRRMRDVSYTDMSHYVRDLQANRLNTDAEVKAIVEVLATHTTSFFREPAQFDWLYNQALPEIVELGAGIERPLIIWSAACSIGAEMWTAAMIAERYSSRLPRKLRWSVWGSDVSAAVLARAERAIYTDDEISGLPDDFRRSFLLRSREQSSNGTLFRVIPQIRQKAKFYQANLVQSAPQLEGKADIAFLRNVLIYFDAKGKEKAVRNVLNSIRSGGYLLTGHAESLNPLPSGLQQCGSSIYRKI